MEWKPIESFDRLDRNEVDVWMEVHASPRSMGWADAFRVPDAYRVQGKWFHVVGVEEKELYAAYITHWMDRPGPPA